MSRSKELLSKTSAVARHRNCLWRVLPLPLISWGMAVLPCTLDIWPLLLPSFPGSLAAEIKQNKTSCAGASDWPRQEHISNRGLEKCTSRVSGFLVEEWLECMLAKHEINSFNVHSPKGANILPTEWKRKLRHRDMK